MVDKRRVFEVTKRARWNKIAFEVTKEPDGIKSPEKIGIDWSRTKVWGEGGYYGRVFLNVKGREPQGVIEPSQYEAIREEIIDKLENLPDEFGNSIGTKVFRPEALYKELRGIPPDLIVYFGNLAWRSVGSVGHKTIWTHENDTGPDVSVNHLHIICYNFRIVGIAFKTFGCRIHILPE
ncbi:hypothetical protein M1146_06745, partial [Patescibacteria group bacterium]|nr:hypothetical protein [Patescibacteria group bacterium]